MIKKVCISCIGFFLFLPLAGAKSPYSDSVKKIMVWGDSVLQEVEVLTSGDDKEKAEKCYQQFGKVMDSNYRLDFLGLSDFYESTELMFANPCLRDDVYAVDPYIRKIVQEVAHSEIACNKSELQKYTDYISLLKVLKSGLIQYGDIDNKNDENKNYISDNYDGKNPIPEVFINDFSFWDEEYQNEAVCSNMQSFFTFHQLKQQTKDIMKKIENLKDFSESVSLLSRSFSSNEDKSKEGKEMKGDFWKDVRSQAKSQGKAEANAWFSRNIEGQIHGAFSQMGLSTRLITAGDRVRQAEKEKSEKKHTPEELCKNLTFEEYSKISKEISQVLQKRKEEIKKCEDIITANDRINSTEEHSSEFDEVRIPKLESDIEGLPKEIENTNAHLKEATDLLQRLCTRHGSCD